MHSRSRCEIGCTLMQSAGIRRLFKCLIINCCGYAVTVTLYQIAKSHRCSWPQPAVSRVHACGAGAEARRVIGDYGDYGGITGSRRGITGTGYELRNLSTRSLRQTCAVRAAPLLDGAIRQALVVIGGFANSTRLGATKSWPAAKAAVSWVHRRRRVDVASAARAPVAAEPSMIGPGMPSNWRLAPSSKGLASLDTT